MSFVRVKQIPIELVHRAWRECRPGLNYDFAGHSVVKTPKMLLFMPPVSRWPTNHPRSDIFLYDLPVVAFPKKEHLQRFAAARQGVVMGGPSDVNRGAIGTISLEAMTVEKGKVIIRVGFIQSHYKTGRDEYSVPRGLATYYSGWRQRALDECAAILKARRVPMHVPLHVVTEPATRGGGPRKQLIREIKRAARNAGLTVKRGKSHLLVK